MARKSRRKRRWDVSNRIGSTGVRGIEIETPCSCGKKMSCSVSSQAEPGRVECSEFLGGCGQVMRVPKDVWQEALEAYRKLRDDAAKRRHEGGGSGAWYPI